MKNLLSPFTSIVLSMLCVSLGGREADPLSQTYANRRSLSGGRCLVSLHAETNVLSLSLYFYLKIFQYFFLSVYFFSVHLLPLSQSLTLSPPSLSLSRSRNYLLVTNQSFDFLDKFYFFLLFPFPLFFL